MLLQKLSKLRRNLRRRQPDESPRQSVEGGHREIFQCQLTGRPIYVQCSCARAVDHPHTKGLSINELVD